VRFNNDTLTVRISELTIADVLGLSMHDALGQFGDRAPAAAVTTHQDLEHALKAAVVRLRRSSANRIETGYTSCPSRSASRAVKPCRPPLG
jgi:hypothetical protein